MSTARWTIAGILLAALVIGGLFLAGFFGEENKGLQPAELTPAPISKGRPTPAPPKGPGAQMTSTPFDPSQHVAAEGRMAGGNAASGWVEGPDGQRLQGARVDLVQDFGIVTGQIQEGSILRHVMTGSDGAFVFDGLEPGSYYVLRGQHADFASQRVGPLELGEPDSLQQVIRLTSGLGFSGKVSDVAGRPIAGAKIEVLELDTMSPHREPRVENEILSNKAGEYRVAQLRPGKKRVYASCQGFSKEGRADVQLDPEKPTADVDFVLTNGASISGVVEDHVSQKPVEGVRVVAQASGYIPPAASPGVPVAPSERGDGAPEREPRDVRKPGLNLARIAFVEIDAVTDAEGRFVLDGLNEARYSLTFNKWGYQELKGVLADAGDTQVRARILRASSITGRVLDGTTGKPLSNFTVGASRDAGETPPPPNSRQVFRDAQDGQFEYLNAPPGRLYLVVDAPDYAGGVSDALLVAAGEPVRDVVVPMVKGGILSGRVSKAVGGPLRNATVTAIRQGQISNPLLDMLRTRMRGGGGVRTFTDAEGKYTFGNLKPGSYAVRATHVRHVDAEVGPVSCESHQETPVPNLALAEGGVVRGVVKAENSGAPDPRAKVLLQNTALGQTSYPPVETDAEGRFKFSAVKPGTYYVIPIERGGVMNPFAIFQGPQAGARPTVVVTEGGDHAIDL